MTEATDLSLEALVTRLEALEGATPFGAPRSDGIWMDAPELDVKTMVQEMTVAGYRLATMSGCPVEDAETVIMYHFNKGPSLVHFKTRSHDGTHPSLATLSHPASWCERELHDFFAVKFEGHPNLVPLLRPEGLNEGFFREQTQIDAGNA